MNLTLDIGNTKIKAGLFKGSRKSKEISIKIKDIPKIVNILNKSGLKSPKNAIICSTIPKINQKIAKIIQKRYKIKPKIVGKDIQLKIKSKYINYNKLGIDRLVNMYGALCRYPCPLIVVSFGTAITIDVISKNRTHEGGFILPGIKMGLEALNTKTAALPYVPPKRTRAFVRRDTKGCINSGVLYGTGFAIDGILKELKKKYKGSKILAVGGDSKLMQSFTPSFDFVRSDHTLHSLNLLLSRK